MSASSISMAVYKASYPSQPGAIAVFNASYPGATGSKAIHDASYPSQPGAVAIYDASYPNAPGALAVYRVGCFPASEPVHTCSDMYAPIGSLKTGDKIGSWDVEKKKMRCTAVTKIHKYTVNDILCFNKIMRVSASHPLMVMESVEKGIVIPAWKVAFDVKVGDCVVGTDGKLTAIKTKSRHWYNDGIEVLTLSTDDGVPFLVGNCVVRAENAQDGIGWANAPVTQKLAA
uniref:Hint domain-containing protein n=1 Tax=uncultured bacterium contig00032 TaxID=1181521 RepID=A0A806KAW5_9BACT|nr:hypothetical protein [uncultured bacterium contig00032]